MKISIITPVFNRVSSIQKTIDSVAFEKSNNDIEYIIIDGSSTDGTLDVIKNNSQYIDKIISEKDNGIYDAINKGIKVASGDYVFILASDDILLKGSIKFFLESLKSNIDVWCGSIVIKQNYGKNYYCVYSESNFDFLYDHCSLRHPATFFRKSIFERFGYYDTFYNISGDWEIFLRFYENKASFQIENYPIVLFSVNGVSSTSNLSRNIIDEDVHILRKYGVEEDKISQIVRKKNRMFDFSNSVYKKMLIGFLLKFHLIDLCYFFKSGKQKYLSSEELVAYGIYDIKQKLN